MNTLEDPLVSIVIPVRNEEDYLEGTLRSILLQDYSHERLEIVVADGQSEDRTREIVVNFQNDFSNLKLVDNPKKNTPSGLNHGIKAASGQIIIIVGGHCELAPSYVRLCVYYLSSNNIDCVGGILTNVAEGKIGEAIAFAISSPFGAGNAAFRVGLSKPALVDTVPFGAYKRSVMETIGGFDEAMLGAEDDEFNYRLRKNGGRILLVPLIRSQYFTRSTFSNLRKQYFNYGLGKAKVLWKHPHQMALRQFVPPAFVAALITSAFLAAFFSLGRFLLVSVISSYLLLNLGASILTASRRGWKYIFLFPPIYMLIHLSYGFGFLIGLLGGHQIINSSRSISRERR
jgi:glycosyltransferase involved in cell wall biosynthesis